MRYLPFLILLVLLTSCTSKNTSEVSFKEFPTVELHEVSSIKTFNNGDFFARPHIVTPLRNNQFLIADTQLLSLFLFDKNADYLGSYGRNGKGPGEFLRMNNIFIKGDTINVVDGKNLRISSYIMADDKINLLGEHEFRYMMLQDYPLALFTEFISSENGELTAVYYDFDNLSRDEMKLTKMLTIPYSDTQEQQNDSTIQVFEMVTQLHKDRTILTIPYKTRGYFATLNGGYVYALNDEPKISIYDLDGSVRTEIKLPDTRVDINREEKEAAYDYEYQNSPDPGKFKSIVMQQMPDQRPVIQDLKTDADNRIWVQIYRNVENSADWFVYEENGSPVASIDVPADLTFRNASGNRLYTQKNTEEGPEIVILEWIN